MQSVARLFWGALPACLCIFLLVLPTSAVAQPTLADIVASSDCLSDRPPDGGGLVNIASAWAGKETTPFMADLGLDAFLPLDPAQLETALRSRMPQVIEALARDISALGDAVCPVLYAQAYSTFDPLSSEQNNGEDYYAPYLTLGEIMVRQGCPVDLANKTWVDAAAAVTDFQVLPGTRVPTPGSVARLTQFVDEGSCGSLPTVPGHVVAMMTALVFETFYCGEEPALSIVTEPFRAPARDVVDTFAAKYFARDCDLSPLAEQAKVGLVLDFDRAVEPDIFAHASPGSLFYFGMKYFAGQGAIIDRDLGLSLLRRSTTPEAMRFLETAVAAGVVAEDVAPSYPTVPPPFGTYPNSSDFYPHYRLALSGGLPPVDAARAMIQHLSDPSEQAEYAEIADGVRLEVAIPTDRLLTATYLTELYQRFAEVRELIEAEAGPTLKFVVATVLFEGHTELGRDIERGVPLLEAASDAGISEAQLRFAVAIANGFGMSADFDRAVELLTNSARNGQLAALSLLAPLIDRSGAEAEAAAVYEVAARIGAPSPTELGSFLARRMSEGSPYLSSAEGQVFLEQIGTSNSEIAIELSDAFLCTDCGGVANLEAGLRFLKVAHDGGSYLATQRYVEIALRRPDLIDASFDPAQLGDSPLLTLVRAASTSNTADAGRALLEAAEVPCFELEYGPTSCIGPAHDLAIGAYGTQYAAAGFTLLKRIAALPGSIVYFGLSETLPYDPDAIAALGDVLAYYGDYAGAAETLSRLSNARMLVEDASYGSGGFTARNAVIRRAIVSGAVAGREPDPALVTLLRTLAAIGDPVANSFLGLISMPGFSGALDPPPRDLEAAVRDYDAQLRRGGLSRGLVSTARTVSAAYRRSGDNQNALKFELLALQTERSLGEIAALTDGPLPAALSAICELSKSSRRISAMGFPAAARALAKEAVNRLQDVRRDISALPESLQLCFANQVSDTYRLLADLFIEQDREVEADYVMNLLKDYETFRYVQRDPLYADEAFDGMLLTETEQETLGAIAGVSPPLAAIAAKRDALVRALEARELTEAETAELDELDATIRAASERLDAVVADLASARDDDPDVLEAAFNSMRGRLRREFGARAVSLRYVVLPHRMHVIVATPAVVTSYTWDELDGQPFSEAALNALVAEFREKLENPQRDPRPAGQKLFDLLLKPIWGEIAAVDANRLLLSLDRQLRFVPFAALYNNDRYLVQDIAITGLSGSQQPVDIGLQNSTTITAMGVSEPAAGFSALPAVEWEVAGLVDDEDGYGLMDGRVALDDKFTRNALRAALAPNSDGGLETIHIASHFALGQNDAESFLVLGNGDRLTVADLKTGIGDQTYDFGSVDLLTLSACQTAVPVELSDGSELESFASIVQANAGRAVLATLWPIADKSTALLMQRFYEQSLLPDMPRSEALAISMREFITSTIGGDDPGQSVTDETARRGEILVGRDPSGEEAAFPQFQHPYYWAAFVLLEGH